MTALQRLTTSEIAKLAFIVLMILAGRSSLADHYHIPSGSMEHTLRAGDRVLVDKRAYGLRIPFTRYTVLGRQPARRGDIAIFDSPLDGTRLIKRVVAVGGDEVELTDGRLIINGQPLGMDPSRERFGSRIAELNLESGGGSDAYIRRVPTGTVLALGDHRGNSRDGRAFGLLPEAALYGRAVAVYFREDDAFVWKRL